MGTATKCTAVAAAMTLGGRPGMERHPGQRGLPALRPAGACDLLTAMRRRADSDGLGGLSFRNLVELQVLRALRAKHGVPLDTIRRAIDFMRKQLGVEHPLADHRMRTDGKELFVNLLEALVRVNDGQVMLREVVSEHLARIEWKGQDPARLYPFPHAGPKTRRDVVLDPRIRWGRPVLVGTAIPVDDIAERKAAGESISSIAKDYGRPIPEIRSALRFAA